MPAEFSPHQGCILIWPERPGSWKNGAAAARKAFRSVIAAIAESETVYVAVNPHSRPSAERMLAGMANVRLLDLDSDDAWARDVAPTFVRRAADGAVRGVNWRFNSDQSLRFHKIEVQKSGCLRKIPHLLQSGIGL